MPGEEKEGWLGGLGLGAACERGRKELAWCCLKLGCRLALVLVRARVRWLGFFSSFLYFLKFFKKPKQKCFEVEVGCFETFEKEKQYKINLGPHITCGGFEKGRGENNKERG